MSGNNGYIAPNGESIFQRGEIAQLNAKVNTIETDLKAKVDITKYQGKINLLEANDLRHDADIAYLEANKLDKTTFDAKINALLAKDATHDLRLNTLDALQASKVDISEYTAAIAGLTGVDAAFKYRLDILQAQHSTLNNQLVAEVQKIVDNYITDSTYEVAIAALKDADSALYTAIATKADQVIADQIQAGLAGITNSKVSKTEFATDKANLEALNLQWERRLNAVDQYIRAMIETYEIKKPGESTPYEYTAAFQNNWIMKEDHFTIVGRNPGGEVVLELPDFSYNSFYGKIEMFLNSSVSASTKTKAHVQNSSSPYRVVMDAGFASTFELNDNHFPITVTMYDSAGAEIKTKSISKTIYQNLPIVMGAAFTYPKTSFNLVRGSSVQNNNVNMSPLSYAGSNLQGATWAVTNGTLPSGIELNPSTGAISGFPNSDAVLGTSTVKITSTKLGQPNSLVLTFNIVAPHTITYTPNAEYGRNNDMTNLVPAIDNSAAPNNVFTFSVTNPDSDLTQAEKDLGMFTKGVYITMANDALNSRTAGTIWGNPKNVGERTYTVKAIGLNGVEATTTVTLKVVNSAPAFNYNHVIVAPATSWNDYTHTVRVNDVLVFLPNVAGSSGEIKGADYPVALGGPKPNYEISPAFPAGANLVFDADTGKIYTPDVAPINGVQQPQGVLQAFNAQTYTITAYGPGGSATATFKLQCLGPIPNFSYNPIGMDFVKGVAGTVYTPSNVTGVQATGGFTLYNLNGNNSNNSTPVTLPANLSFNVDTGAVSGTPNAVAATTGYSVRAVGPNGTSIAVPFYITVKDAIPAFDYDSNVNVFVRGSAGTPFAPVAAADSGVINFYALFNNNATPSPAALPAGLNFNNNNGQITGTPLVSAHGTPVTYKVKAYGPGGESVFKTFQLQINEPVPVIAYNSVVPKFTVGVAINPIAPTIKQNDINTWSATGLPTGVTIHPSTGVISGTPTNRQGPVSVSITANGDGGVSNTVALSMEVDYQAPVFSYSAGTKTIMAGANITPIAPAVSVSAAQGAGFLTWTSSPALPTGLILNQDGSISGSTTVLGGPITYTITAANGDNNGTATVVLNVDTDVTGSANLAVLIGDADYDAKELVSTTSNSDVVFIKKVSAGNLENASLVYEDANSALVEIAKKTLIAGDFVSFQVDRTVPNPTQKLYVFANFVAQTSVQGEALAKIQYEPTAPFTAAVIGDIAPVSVEKGAVLPTITLTATGDVIANTWAATGLPNGLVCSSNGQISGTVSAGVSAGPYTVTASVSGKGGNGTKQFTITVTDPPPGLITVFMVADEVRATNNSYTGLTTNLEFYRNDSRFGFTNAGLGPISGSFAIGQTITIGIWPAGVGSGYIKDNSTNQIVSNTVIF